MLTFERSSVPCLNVHLHLLGSNVIETSDRVEDIETPLATSIESQKYELITHQTLKIILSRFKHLNN